MTPEDVRKQELDAKASPVEVVDEAPIQAQHPTSPGLDELFMKGRVAEILGTPALESTKYDLELSAILEWAKSIGANTPEDMFWEIRALKDKIGTAGYGENPIKHLYAYVYLLNESRSIRGKIEKMEKVKVNG